MPINSTIADEYNVHQLVKDAESKTLFIPEFQRHFIWEKNQIKLLIDSLYRRYTINSILIWNGPDELARRRVGGSEAEIITPTGNGETVSYILDGQQRTTALLLVFTEQSVFKGKNTRKQEQRALYFDSQYKGDDPERRFIFDDEILEIDNEEILLRKLSEEQIFKRFGGRFINLKDVYHYKDPHKATGIQNKIIRYFDNNPQTTVSHIGRLNDLSEKILSRKINLIFQLGSLEDVLDIFERINTKNTKLNIYDVMVAKTYKKMKEAEVDFYFNLGSYLKMICSSPIADEYLKNERSIDLEKVKLIPEDDEATLLFLIMIILKQKFVQKEILKMSAENLYDNMKRISRTIHRAVHEMEAFRISKGKLRDFIPLLKFIVACCAKYDGELNSPNGKEFLRHWFWNTLLYNRYPGSQNERIEKDFVALNINKPDETKKIIAKERTRTFENDQLIDACYDRKNEQQYLAITTLLLNNAPRDFYGGIDIGITSKPLEHHHIFPIKSKFAGDYCPRNKDDSEKLNLLNNIANIALLTNETNNSIKNRNPSDYIKELRNKYLAIGTTNDFIEIMKSQLISEEMIGLLEKDDFETFLTKRTELILGKINELSE